MPSFNLTQPQNDIIRTWLFEPVGYLDMAINDQNISAFVALQNDPGLDVTEWIRNNTKHENADVRAWNETAMVWWIMANDQINVPIPQRPPEAAIWAATLAEWDVSINAGFANEPQSSRDNKSTELFDENQQVVGTIPAGAHLAQQQQIITKVLAVLT